jgi:hydrogenase nickel incorporation protein HypA/HybF
MHELAIIQELVGMAEAELSKIGAITKVNTLTIRVGSLSGASPEALNFAFEVVAPSTSLAGAHLNIIESKPICHCLSCHKNLPMDEFQFACPSCKSSDIVIEGGHDLCLESMEVEE